MQHRSTTAWLLAVVHAALVGICSCAQPATNAVTPPSVNILRSNVIAELLPSDANATSMLQNNATAWAAEQNHDGSWPDIDYHPAPNPALRNHWPVQYNLLPNQLRTLFLDYLDNLGNEKQSG